LKKVVARTPEGSYYVYQAIEGLGDIKELILIFPGRKCCTSTAPRRRMQAQPLGRREEEAEEAEEESTGV
jgi:hypothetical protein